MASARKRIVILGAGGFVGSALASRLKKTRHQVVAVTRRAGDLADARVCKRVLKGADTVYYLAASRKNIAEHTARPFDFVADNTLPLLTVLNALKKQEPGLFVYVSSVLAEYAKEDGAVDGYVLAKHIGELIVRSFARQTGWSVKIVRSAAVYGPQKTFDPKTANIIPALIDRIKKNEKEFAVWGTGRRKLQFIHVEDLAANLEAAGLKKTPDFMVVGHPESVSVNALARLIMKKLGKNLKISHDLTKPDKPTKAFRFKNPVAPRINLDKGLDSLIYG